MCVFQTLFQNAAADKIIYFLYFNHSHVPPPPPQTQAECEEYKRKKAVSLKIDYYNILVQQANVVVATTIKCKHE